MDGYVKIGTKLETDEFDMKYKKLERDLEKKEINVQVKVDKANQTQKELENIKQDIIDTEEELGKIGKDAERYAYLNSKLMSTLSPKELAEMWSLEGIDKEEEKIIDKLTRLNSEQSDLNTKLKKQSDEISEANFKLEEAKNKVAKFKEQVEKSKFDKVKKSISEASNTMNDVIKKVGRWALAVFGIRSAYMLVRQAMSTLSEYNEDMANKISNIRLVLATALEPIVNRILSLVITLLSYLNYITKAFFGLDLFARASELSTKKMADNVGAGASAAKEMKKQLAGFDEMNVLSDNDTSGGGGGVGGAKTPEFNLPEAEIPDWLKWIVDNKDLILSVIAGITAGLLAWKLGLTALQSLGIGIAVAGIVYAIQGLLTYLKNPSWENFGKVIIGIGVAIAGIGIAIGALPVVIAGVLVTILGLIIKNWEKIKAFLLGIVEKMKSKSDEIHKKFGDRIGAMYDLVVTELRLFISFLDVTFSALKGVFDGIIKFVKGVFTGNWKQAWEGIKQIFGSVWNWIKNTASIILTTLIERAKAIVHSVGDVIGAVFKSVVNGVLSAVEYVINSPIRAVNRLIKVINKVPGINLGTLSEFNLPRLAKGGIINQPGRGVPVGSAIAGERGQEGVIPLTDAQQMALLGQAIGKYITINANITNSMNGRVISRELQRIQNENDFAFNS